MAAPFTVTSNPKSSLNFDYDRFDEISKRIASFELKKVLTKEEELGLKHLKAEYAKALTDGKKRGIRF